MKAAPEGVSVIHEDKKAALLQVCRELGLPDDAGEGIFFAALALHNFERTKDGQLKSVAKRSQELELVASLAHQLNNALQRLHIADLQCIDDGFKASTLRIHLDPPDPLETVFQHVVLSNVLRTGDVLLTLANIARMQIGAMPKTAKGGRPPVQILYADSLTSVARLAYLNGMKLGQSNDFMRLCEAVFQAQG
jgi:hypothetical protein